MKLQVLEPFLLLPVLASPVKNNAPSDLSSLSTPSSKIVGLSKEENVVYSEKVANNINLDLRVCYEESDYVGVVHNHRDRCKCNQSSDDKKRLPKDSRRAKLKH